MKIKPIPRDPILFVSGLLGIIYETLVSARDRPALLVLFAGMIGLPAFLKKDEEVQQRELPKIEPDPEADGEDNSNV